MSNILIIGAGSMGTAFSFPCTDNNHNVSIIGTHLENDFIDQVNSKRRHPALNCELPEKIKFIKFDKLNEEINKKIDLIVIAVVSKGIEKYNGGKDIYGKGTPVHVKATRLYNHYLKQKQLHKKHPFIQEGEKIKFVYLIQPNPIRDSVIAMMEGLPEEFGLHDYIDYEKQFEKSFRGPLNEILKVIGWSPEKTSSLESFFV